MLTSFRDAARIVLNAYPFPLIWSFKRPAGPALSLALLAFLAQPSAAHEFKIGDIEIDHPWSRATPPGAKVGVGYLAIRNSGPQPDRLVGVTSDIAGKSEIHEMAVDANGVMTMRPMAGGVAIPAGGEAELKAGGLHIMFLELKHEIKAGDMFKGTLTFERAGPVEVEFVAEAMGGSGTHKGDGG